MKIESYSKARSAPVARKPSRTTRSTSTQSVSRGGGASGPERRCATPLDHRRLTLPAHAVSSFPVESNPPLEARTVHSRPPSVVFRSRASASTTQFLSCSVVDLTVFLSEIKLKLNGMAPTPGRKGGKQKLTIAGFRMA